MGWEPRGKSGKQYFYEAVRDEQGRVRKRYLGNSEQARQVAARLAREAAERQQADRAIHEEQQRTSAPLALEDRHEALVALLFEGWLYSQGFWRGRNYGSWRKRRGIESTERGAFQPGVAAGTPGTGHPGAAG